MRPSAVRPVISAAAIFGPVSALAIAAFWLASWSFGDTLTGLDARFLVDLRRLVGGVAGNRGALYELMTCAAALGAFGTLCLVVLFASGLLALAGERAQALLLIARGGGGIAVANLLKVVVNRPRPAVVQHWTSFSRSSFPSGHSADATVIYLLLAGLACEHLRGVAARRFVSCSAVALAMLVGISRLYLGVHWPTDVLGGWSVGSPGC